MPNRCKADRRLGEEMQNEFLEKPLWCEMPGEKVASFAQGSCWVPGREGLDIRQNLQCYAALTNDPDFQLLPTTIIQVYFHSCELCILSWPWLDFLMSGDPG